MTSDLIPEDERTLDHVPLDRLPHSEEVVLDDGSALGETLLLAGAMLTTFGTIAALAAWAWGGA